MNYNIIYKEGLAFEILKEISAHMFQNKNGSINQQVLGMYVNELGGRCHGLVLYLQSLMLSY